MPVKIQPVVKVWCLPPSEEETLKELHRDIVQAVAALPAFKVRDQNDLIVLFPQDMLRFDVGIVILIEFEDNVKDWQRQEGDLASLAACLGHAVWQQYPEAFVQCNVRRGRDPISWTSGGVVKRSEVEKIRGLAGELLPRVEALANTRCYCDVNNADNKGPCHYHNDLGTYEFVVSEGDKILALTSKTDFQPLADVYGATCRDSGNLEELQRAMGWRK